jgi:dTMP kinase
VNNQNLDQLKTFYNSPETPGSFFLSFEGIEGSGKSTQVKEVEAILLKKGMRVLSLREPGGTNFGEKLREAILQSSTPLHPLAECHLFLASRAQLMKEKILPFLLVPNSVVILDRYIDSTLAYQGKARRLGYETVLELHKHNPLCLVPHRTYFLDISLETSMERQSQRGQAKDYFEAENAEFYSRLVEGYKDMAQFFSQRILTIKAHDTTTNITKIIHDDLEKLLT